MTTARALISLAVLAATSGAFAQTPGIVGTGIDANTFIVGHPASPRWVVPHANAEHPAVLQSRAVRPLIDVNTFIVQPPAAVHWLPQASPTALQLAQAGK